MALFFLLCFPEDDHSSFILALPPSSLVSLVLLLICITSATGLQSAARHPSKKIALHSSVDDRVLHNDDDDWPRVYFDIAIPCAQVK
jgi:hypothetical protein